MTYATFIVTIVGGNDSLRFVEVVANGMESASADVRAAYGEDVDIVSIRIA